MPQTFIFPIWLQGTEEQKAAEAERQALALAAHSRAKLTEAERLIGRGQLLEETARKNLESALNGDDETRLLLFSQLADALAMQGRFEEAAAYHPDPVRKEHFEKIGAALEMPDDQVCACEDTKATMNGVELAITPRVELAQVFSPVHGQVVSLVSCSKCGHLNARPLRSRLLQQNAALRSNEAMAKTARPQLMNDAQVLKKNDEAI